MDNKKKIQSGSSRKNIDNIIRDYRRKQTLFVIGTAVTNALIAAFLTIYYSIRQRALVGALYLYDNNSATNLIDRMMHMNIRTHIMQEKRLWCRPDIPEMDMHICHTLMVRQ